jgi:hypothetical protein
MKSVTLPDFLTEEQIQQALELFKKAAPGTFAAECARQIIEPNLQEINRKLGRENDPRYLAYACEFVFNQASQ